MSEFRHVLSETEGTALLAVEGEIDVSNARALRALLLETLGRAQSLGVDLTAVASMDSSGVATLIEARASAKASGKSFKVTAVSERVRVALKLLCLDKMLMG